MLTRALVLASLVLAAVAPEAAASAVVVFRSADRVVLAADSLRQDQIGTRDRVCKVRRAGKWALVFGGFTTSSRPKLDAHRMALDLARDAGRVDDLQQRLVNRLAPAISSALESNVNLEGFENLFGVGPVFTTIVAGMVDGTPTAAVLVLFIESLKPFRTRTAWYTCPGPTTEWCSATGGVYFGSTVSDGPLMQQLVGQRPVWVERGDAAAALRLLREQHDATPHDVAGGDVLELTRAGFRWAHRDADSRCRALSSK